MAQLLLSVMGAFAEFERSLIRERQREGVALAKARGAYRGRKRILSEDRIAELRQRAAAGEAKATLAREFGISRETVYQYLREHPRWPHPVARWMRNEARDAFSGMGLWLARLFIATDAYTTISNGTGCEKLSGCRAHMEWLGGGPVR